MGDTNVMLYVIIIIVALMKVMFWTLYLCLRSRRQNQLRLRQGQAAANARTRPAGITRYEEEVSTPQPAFMFTGFPGVPVQTALTSSLPEYQHEDPYKVDCPPPGYFNECLAEEELPEVVMQVAVPDTQQLVEHPNRDHSAP